MNNLTVKPVSAGNPLQIPETCYTGIVTAAHEDYCFIGAVRRGHEAVDVGGGEVFCPVRIEQGTFVEFDELNPDPRRDGKFRAESGGARRNEVLTRMLSQDDPDANALVLRSLYARNAYHTDAKVIQPEAVKQAAANHPFEHLLLHEQSSGSDVDMTEMVRRYLNREFMHLANFGVIFSIGGDVDTETETAHVEQLLAKYREKGLGNQAEYVEGEYEKFCSLRRFFMATHQAGMLHMESVIPIRYMPDLLVACPVWFIDKKAGVQDQQDEEDPRPDDAVKYFCDTVGSKEFAWLYQMYNRRTRPIQAFTGRDVMPPHVVELLDDARETFDYLVIATPYHDVAAREWADPEWLRNIDPFLIGFRKGIPAMFLLARWSGSGIFPLICDMVADTMEHVRTHKEKLRRFDPQAYWHKGGDRGKASILGGRTHLLVEFADELLEAYDSGQLFPFLRGEITAQ